MFVPTHYKKRREELLVLSEKEELIRRIMERLERCNDLGLLDLIEQLLEDQT